MVSPKVMGYSEMYAYGLHGVLPAGQKRHASMAFLPASRLRGITRPLKQLITANISEQLNYV
jgi:hypothetical protein